MIGNQKIQPADFRIGGLEVWVYERQFPEATDYWDGNWIYAFARCTANSSIVEVEGPILHLSELQELMLQCKQIYSSLSGKAKMKCMEPFLELIIEMRSCGQCELTVSITPDHLYQEHSFIFEIDQSYLPPLIENLENVLKRNPIKGSSKVQSSEF